ncbi:MAG: hypothetical protein ACRDPC_11775 [Solirubrobacteraceae bacterium]
MERQRGEGDVDGDGQGRSQHVDQFDDGCGDVEQLAVGVSMPRDRVGGGPFREQPAVAAGVLDDLPDPALVARPQELSAPLARADAAGALQHRRELARAPWDLGLLERHPGPGAPRAAENLLGGAVDDDAVAAPPERAGGLELGGHQLDEPVEAFGAQQLQEHLLAMPVRLAVEQRHAALVLQQRERRRRQRLRAGEALGLVEDAGGLGSGHAHRRLSHQSRLEYVRPEAPAAVRDELVALAQQRERAVEALIARRRSGGCAHRRSLPSLVAIGWLLVAAACGGRANRAKTRAACQSAP